MKKLICIILNNSFWSKDKGLSITEDDIEDTRESRHDFIKVLQTLEPREVGILIAYDYCGKTFRDCGHMFGVTPERIRQIRMKSLRKLRHPTRTRYIKRLLQSEKEK